MKYKQCKDCLTGGIANSAIRLSDGACFPFDPANTDYAQFKKDILEGLELLDVEGNLMTIEQVTEFLKTLN